MDSHDPSPRASKRRRTGHATRRTTLSTLSTDPTTGSRTPAQNPAKESGIGTFHVVNDPTEVNEEVEGDKRPSASVEPQQLISEAREGEESSNANNPSRQAGGGKKRTLEVESDDRTQGPLFGTISEARKRRDGFETNAEPPEEEEEGQQVSGIAANGNEDKAGEGEVGTLSQEAESQPRSSGRARRPPRRFSPPGAPRSISPSRKQSTQKSRVKPKPDAAPSNDSDIGPEVDSPQPKSILTPSRRGRDKRTGPRKSVAFEADERRIGDHFGFKDIDSSAVKPARRTKTTPISKPVAPGIPTSGEHLDALKLTTTAPEQGTEAGNDTVVNEDDEEEEEEATFDPVPDVTVLSLPPGSAVQTQKAIEDDAHIASIKTEVLNRMQNHSLCPITHLQSQYTTLHALLTATVTAGESNSLLLLGSRGSGKSLLTSHAISELTRSHGDDFHVVRLNGFFQTDDKLALREIWRQLGREMAVPEDETGEVSSYADTMASLLSLLSHPGELADLDSMMLDGDHDQQAQKTAKSVIFVLDEFDLFTTHPRQTLLYNLFDIAQAKKAPIAVIGCSCRMDVVDCLEKRVKSRFSHRWLHIPSGKSLGAFEDSIASILCLAVEDKEALGLTRDELDGRIRWNHAVKARLLPSASSQALLKKTFYSTKSIPDVLAALYIPITMLPVPRNGEPLASDQQDPNIPVSDISSAGSSSPPSVLTLLPQLPTVHLTLLICAARLETIHDLSTLNFALVHAHYTELLARSKMQRSALSSLTRGGAVTGSALRSWSKDTVRAAWEELVQWELLVPVSGLGGGNIGGKLGDEGLGGDGVATRMFRVDVTLDEVAWAVKAKSGHVGTGEVLEKWCKEM